MSSDVISQRRDGRVLCEVPDGGLRVTRFFEGADATSSAFAHAAHAVRALGRDDAAIAAAWAARVARRTNGADAVRAYDDSGAWTAGMEEAFAYGFVAFLRNASWSVAWPRTIEHWRTRLSSAMAVCAEGAESHAVASLLDDPMRALYVRLIWDADEREQLPFAPPVVEARAPYGGPDATSHESAPAADAARRRKASVVVGEPEPPPAEPHAGPMFSGIEERSPRAFGPALVAVAGLLVAVALGTWLLYAFALRPGVSAARTAGAATLEQLKNGKASDMYQTGASRLRAESWTDFAGRVRGVENLGKLTASSEPSTTVARDPELGRSATVAYDAKFTFGTAHVAFKYVDVGFSGDWRLAEVDLDPHPDLAEPPYAATDEGADALARRFVYAFQLRDFDTIAKIIPADLDADRLKSFRASLVGDGFVTLVDRLSIETKRYMDRDVRVATYRIETNRDHRAGTIAFALLDEGGAWQCVGAANQMNYW